MAVTGLLLTGAQAGNYSTNALTLTGAIDQVTANTANYGRSRGVPLKIRISELKANASCTLLETISLVGVGTDGSNLTSTNGVTLSTNATYLFYTNSVTPNVNDRFSYSVTDTRGCTAVGTVTITVTNSMGPVTITDIGGGTVVLSFYGIPGYQYLMQRSCNDLNSWADLSGVLTAPASGNVGLIQYTNTPGGGCSPAYYRVRQN